MFRLLTFSVLGLIVSLLGLAFVPATAEKPQPNIELKLSLSKSEIVQLEPIALTISVKNLSKEPQEIYPTFDRAAQHLIIIVTTNDGKTIEWHPGDIIIEDAVPNLYTLSPKDVIRYRMMLSDEPHSWMDTPGEYKLHITFDCLKAGAKPLESKPVKLTVKAAEGIDKEALHRFRGYPQAEFLTYGSTCDAILFKQFVTVTQIYPKSVYTPWCYYALGRAAQSDFTCPFSKVFHARDYYEQLLKRYPKFPMKTEVEYEMAREFLRLGKDDEAAINQIESLINKHSDLWFLRQVNFTLESYRKLGKIAPAKELPKHW